MSEKQQLIERWDTYISKIKQRCDEMIAQANQGTDFFIPQLMFDTIAIHNAWQGIKAQVFQLDDKLDEGWNKMEDLFDQAGSSSKETEKERAKMEEAKIQMHWTYEKNLILAQARAARKLLQNVKLHINENKIHTCTQCGNPLNINIYTFRAMNIKCDACESVNTYTPDERIITLEAWVIVPLANESALAEKESEYFAEESRKWKDRKVLNEENIKLIEYRKASINKYFQFLIDSIPEKAEFYIRQRDERLIWAERLN
jgi:hypothetical protein